MELSDWLLLIAIVLSATADKFDRMAKSGGKLRRGLCTAAIVCAGVFAAVQVAELIGVLNR